ncbi:MAG: hypothetical protein JJT99_02315 [Rhodobacteraceae bacterium]|nr:hypothetical protein [Paracoccaceae bacterium]
MWSSKRRGVLLGGVALALAGCGFTPAYAPGGAGQTLRGQVRARDPENDADFDFVAALESRLGRAGAGARYALDYDITIDRRGSASVAGLGETRVSLIGALRYRLTQADSGAEVASGSLRNFTNYSTTATQLATLRAQEDAQARLMRILADQLTTRLIAALAE